MPKKTQRPKTPPVPTPDLRQWQKLAGEFPDDPRLKSGTLYALPHRLIDAVRRYAPKVLTANDAKFEHRLRSLSATGFLNRETLFSDLLDGHQLHSGEFEEAAVADRRERVTIGNFEDVRDTLASDRLDAVVLQRRNDAVSAMRLRIQLRLKGYVGWLVTHPAYVVDACQFSTRHGSLLTRAATMPTRHRLRVLPPSGPAALRQLDMDAMTLMNKWALDGLTDTILPIPCQPGFLVRDKIPQNGIASTGVSLHVPWPLLADQNFTLREIVSYHSLRVNLQHLDEWMKGERNWSFNRYARLLDLYVYRELALSQRYSAQMNGHVEAVNRAFGGFWLADRGAAAIDDAQVDKSVDGVRQIRTKLLKRLTACQQAWESEAARIVSGEPKDPHADAEEEALLKRLSEEIAPKDVAQRSDPAALRPPPRRRRHR